MMVNVLKGSIPPTRVSDVHTIEGRIVSPLDAYLDVKNDAEIRRFLTRNRVKMSLVTRRAMRRNLHDNISKFLNMRKP